MHIYYYCNSTYEDVTPQSLMSQLLKTEPCKLGCLNVYECFRVPKRFHALFSATWRRYLFLFPLNQGNYPLYNVHQPHFLSNDQNTQTPPSFSHISGAPASQPATTVHVDVNVARVNTLLNQLQNKSLPYNAYAFRHDRSGASDDVCHLYVARAFTIALPPPSFLYSSSSSVSSDGNNYSIQSICDSQSTEIEGNNINQKESQSKHNINHNDNSNSDNNNDADAFSIQTDPSINSNSNNHSMSTNTATNNSSTPHTPSASPHTRYAMCVELVGDRFLRRMVRILVASAVRASLSSACMNNNTEPIETSVGSNIFDDNNNIDAADKNISNSNTACKDDDNNNLRNNNTDDATNDDNILVKIALQGERNLASVAVDGRGMYICTETRTDTLTAC